MSRPTQFPEWASTEITETVPIGGVDVDIDNKKEPTPEWKASGSLYNENTPYPYFNYQFDLTNNWVINLDQRAGGVVGDIYTTTASPSVSDVQDRFGGVWVDRGSDTLAGQTVNVYERTA